MYLTPAYHFSTMTLDNMGRLDEAIKHVRERLKHGPDDTASLNQAAYLLEKKGNYKEARQLLRNATIITR